MSFIRALPFISIFPVLFLCSCGDTVVESTGAEQMLKGNISVIVTDASTGLPIRNASVMLLGRDGKTRQANSNGGILYENLLVGKDYAFYIEAPSYASMKCKADIYLDSLMGSNLEVRLPKLGAKLQGSLAYANMETSAFDIQPVGYSEAIVRLRMHALDQCELADPYREALASLDGSYFFDSLPELALYDLTALETKIGGIAYKYFLIESGGVLGLSGDIAKAPLGIYKDAASPEEFRLLSAPDNIAQNGKISLAFSKDINKSRTGINSFSIAGASYALDVKWSGERTLEISPIGGIWKLDDMVVIANTSDLYAADGTILAAGILAIVTVTNGNLEKISKLWLENPLTGTALNAKGDSLDLNLLLAEGQGLVFRWNKASNAASYVIYAKCADEINYGQITTGLSFTADTAAAWNYWQAYYCMEQDKQSSFFVQAINSKEYTNSDFISVMGY